MVNLTINGESYCFNEGMSILEAARSVDIYIPTLCFLKNINKDASCRVCLVENKGRLIPACDTTISEGMEILTNSSKVRNTRKTILELIAADHNFDCGHCIKNSNCELKKLCEIYNIRENTFESKTNFEKKDKSSIAIIRDESKCIKCGRCVVVCRNNQGVDVLCYSNRAQDYKITTEFDKDLNDSSCIFCGQCSKVCPVGAIYERENLNDLYSAIDNKSKHVVVQIAPAVRVSIANELGIEGCDLSGKIVTLLKLIGVDKVFDTNFGADLTIMEETEELIRRINNNGVLPLMTSCSPGWINYVEKHRPELIPNLSSCKSPQQMFGAILKSYYSKKADIDYKNIVSVSIMPCTAKKYEAHREEFSKSGVRDVDIVITTRELLRLIKETGINFDNIPSSDFDNLLGISSGAANIFGASGGVMEAALRTAYEKITGYDLKALDFYEVRGTNDFKEAAIDLNGKEIKVAVVNGIKNVDILLNKIKNGENYCFVEVMCCPGGCIGGGGQPYNIDESSELINKMKKIYSIDKNKIIRKSHENPNIIKIYNEYLGEPGSHKAEELLHTKYFKR
ncbi:NADH-dependent [FeFe] hydrogenase, group A6 [Clostridium cuniculi]|uniref:NADH-dependent [FeFe] hydrogenase, group A6 n=1 Tax=Clostridium cuniculi TaxID=2548455 RepID=UPI0018ABBD36|nr:NADH-dependent [FeFe] hydrogenase, group A6 [Clostridium cuniculi]